MLFELEPAREITGGAWYTEQEFDAEFVAILKQQCLQVVQKQVGLRASLFDVPYAEPAGPVVLVNLVLRLGAPSCVCRISLPWKKLLRPYATLG